MNLGLVKNSVVTQVTESFSNSASVTASNGAPANTAIVNTSVVIASDITYTLVVSNAGDADATFVTLTDFLPAGVAIIANPDGGFVSGSTVTWNLGTVAANGGTVTVTLTVRTQ